MAIRFRKSIKVAPGLRLNISKSGVSTSVGGKGLTANVSKRGGRNYCQHSRDWTICFHFLPREEEGQQRRRRSERYWLGHPLFDWSGTRRPDPEMMSARSSERTHGDHGRQAHQGY
ncbi:TPA: DUF4236 domain-containing protein [Pseudomonas aeruginosa]|uniref:DUF4236 domain-containing protein n=1 Tax=Pseudomonas aeruginosa TaxID=287 RepID=UPI0039173401